MSFPNRGRLERALSNLDLLVVQDGFETPTTALADVVLPAAIWGEKDGTYTNAERRVSRVRKAVAPPGPGPVGLRHLPGRGARRWACGRRCIPGGRARRTRSAEWGRVSAGRLCDY